jgi:hypothetical protein
MRRLQELVGVPELPITFLETGAAFDPTPFVQPFSREVDVEPLLTIFEEAMSRYAGAPEKADAWLAPRLHYALRLSRREAARRGIWIWLGVVLLPEFVRWRFPSAPTPMDRFLGREDKHAIGRLWWGAELMRNGEDYKPVEVGFQMQDIPNTWMRLDAFHHRGLVQASLRVLGTFNDGGNATSDQVNALAKAVNAAARTTLLDGLAPDWGPDAAALEAWLAGDVDETTILKDLPTGPMEEGAGETAISAIEKFVRRVASRAPGLAGPIGSAS